MIDRITFNVNGVPKGQPRPRAVHHKGFTRVYDPGTAEGWKACVAQSAENFIPKIPWEGNLKVDIEFILPRPKRLCRKRDDPCKVYSPVKPDLDNAAKAILDTLTNLGMWKDDALVVELQCKKFFHPIGGRPGAIITIEKLSL